MSWDKVVGIEIRLQTEWSGVQTLAWTRDFSVLRKCPGWLWGPLNPYSVDRRVLSWGQSSWGVKLTTHFHIALWLMWLDLYVCVTCMPSWCVQVQLHIFIKIINHLLLLCLKFRAQG